jgi:hypothetical protein
MKNTIETKVLEKIWKKFLSDTVTKTDVWMYYVVKERLAGHRYSKTKENSEEERRYLKKMDNANKRVLFDCPIEYRGFINNENPLPIMDSLLHFYSSV